MIFYKPKPITFVLAFLMLCACSFGDGDVLDTARSGGIYISGTYNNRACYWKVTGGNVLRVDLPDSGWGGEAMSIFVQNSNVYTAGGHNYDATLKHRACYWKNNYRIDLDWSNRSVACSIYVANDNVYASGFYEPAAVTACYWINDSSSRTDLPGGTPSEARAITVNNNSVYVSGFYFDGSDNAACYWTNGVLSTPDLSDGELSETNSILIYNNNIYVSGVTRPAATNLACYWINDAASKTELHSISASEANSIVVHDDIIYTAGYYENATPVKVACYWRVQGANIARFDLYNGSTDSMANAIAVSNNDVYVVGHYVDSGTGKEIPCFWKNGEKTNLEGTDSSVNANFASDIFIVR